MMSTCLGATLVMVELVEAGSMVTSRDHRVADQCPLDFLFKQISSHIVIIIASFSDSLVFSARCVR